VPETQRPLRLQPDDRFAFFRGFLKRPKQVGSIIPSSRFLERRVTRATRAHRAKLIVELGPGTGGTTRALLRAMQPEARLLAIEINPHFVELLQRRPDKRLIVEQDIEDLTQVSAGGRGNWNDRISSLRVGDDRYGRGRRRD